jgi:hypothetical protein
MSRTCVVLTCLFAFAAASCEEEAPPSKVYGTVDCSACSKEFSLSGDLSEGDSKYYGYCSTDGDGNMKFMVGTDDKAHATSSADFVLQLTGIQGPPTDGAYASTTPLILKDGPATDFGQGYIKNVNEFSFSQADAGDPDLCVVTLYAVPAEGELTPAQTKFHYFVGLDCRTLSVSSSSGAATLNSVYAELWFTNCD